MIVPFAPGAPVDTVGRLIADRMAASLGQPIVMENVSGAAGGIAVARAARAAPDGYTLSLGNISSHVLNGAISPQSFDALKDFEPVALLASNPQLIISKNALPANDLKGLIAWLKANPDKATAGTGGNGGVSHVAGLFFQKKTGTRFQFASYRGTNLAQQDLIGGQIDLLFDQVVSALVNVRAGMPPRRRRLPRPPCASISTSLGSAFRLLSNRHPKRWAPSTRPRSRNGGRSSRRRTSRWNEPIRTRLPVLAV
jgi:tripartite-type tricarboxylate transporter receptor subunit TctC